MDDIEGEVNEFTKRAFLTKILYHRDKENEYIMNYNKILCTEAFKTFDLSKKNRFKCTHVYKYQTIWEIRDQYFKKKNKELEKEFLHMVFEDDLQKQYIFLYIQDYLKVKYDGINQEVSPDLIHKVKKLSDELFYYQNEINLKKK